MPAPYERMARGDGLAAILGNGETAGGVSRPAVSRWVVGAVGALRYDSGVAVADGAGT
ncbi:MAG: hypothetical protein QM753_01495 [Thermomicrobiales bacterium]